MNNTPASTVSLDLPPALAALMNMGKPAIPSYAAGGMIGPGGQPEAMMPQATPAAPQMPGLNMPGNNAAAAGGSQDIMTQVQQFASQNPQQVEQIKQAILQAIQSGELTQQELNMVVQLATVAAQSPDMYPNIRSYAIQQGIATEQDLPQQYDQGLVFVLLLAAKAVQASNAGAGGQAKAPGLGIPSMAKGGEIPDSKKEDGSVLINGHEGEYVIPRNVVKMKGREFFDNLVEKYKDVE